MIAYEPVWAIGTGEVATPEDAQEVCGAIRARLAERFARRPPRRPYPLRGFGEGRQHRRASSPGPDVDGALVGGASLDGAEFAGICVAAGGGPISA